MATSTAPTPSTDAWASGGTWTSRASWDRTDTPGREGSDHAYNVSANYESQKWRFQAGSLESGEDFNPEVGFVRRVGFRKVDGGIFYTWRPENFLSRSSCART